MVSAAKACPHGIAMARGDRIVFLNTGYARLLGYKSVAAVRAQPARVVLEEAKVAVANQNGNEHPSAPELEAIEFHFRHGGRPVHLQVLRDVTERRRLERQLRTSQKMEALGRTVGGVAHDFNNLLTAVTLYCDLLRQQLPAGNVRRHAEEINLAAQRGAALVRQLLAFARQQVLEPKVLSLNAVLLGMRNMLQRLVGEEIELVTCCPESLRSVKIDPAQIQQVILNLVVNARDAMPGGGKLVLETANVLLDAVSARRHHGLPAGRYVRLIVTDTGCGMSPDTMTRIFEPFFTTKERGRGTGLGLPMVYGIVTQSGGTIDIHSTEGKGTRVSILLPCAGAKVRRVPGEELPADDPTRAPATAATVLLVEHDAAICDSAAQVLERAGYRVLRARSYDEALRRTRQHAGPIEILLCDLGLPGASGRESAFQILAEKPGTAVVYMSSCASRAEVKAATRTKAIILQKPFTESTLVHAVREALETRSPGARTGEDVNAPPRRARGAAAPDNRSGS